MDWFLSGVGMDINDIMTVSRRGIDASIGREEYMSTVGLNPSSIVAGYADGAIDVLAVKSAYEKEFERKSTDQMDRGTLGHIALLEPERLGTDVAIWNGERRSGSKWTEFQNEHAGKLIVRSSDYDDIMFCVTKVMQNLHNQRPDILDLISEGQAEVGVYSEEESMQVKGQVDWINTAKGADAIVDLKFSEVGIGARSFDRNVVRFQYDQKMACYHRWFTRESGKAISRCVIISICTVKPYALVAKDFGEMALEHGWYKAVNTIRAVRKALDENDWPMSVHCGEYIPPSWEMEPADLVDWGA